MKETLSGGLFFLRPIKKLEQRGEKTVSLKRYSF